MVFLIFFFFAIYQHELAIGIHVSSSSWTPLPPPCLLYPSEPWLWVPCFMNWFFNRSIICFTYGNVHISVLFSQPIPLLTSPTKKIKQNLPLLTKWVRCSKLHTWKILDEDLKQFMPESNRIIFLLPRQRPAASITCRTLSEMQSPWYLESDLLNHNLHLNKPSRWFTSTLNLGCTELKVMWLVLKVW